MQEEDNQIEQGGIRVGEQDEQDVSSDADLRGGDINIAPNEPPIIIQGGGEGGISEG